MRCFLHSFLILNKGNQKLHAALAQLSIHGLWAVQYFVKISEYLNILNSFL